MVSPAEPGNQARILLKGSSTKKNKLAIKKAPLSVMENLARKSCLNFPFYPKNTTRKLEGKESQVQPKNCLDFEFGS